MSILEPSEKGNPYFARHEEQRSSMLLGSSHFWRRRIGSAFAYVALFAVCGWMLLPIVWAFSSSLKPLDEVYAIPPKFTVGDCQGSNYLQVITQLPFGRMVLNSTWISVISAAGAVLTSSMAGFALAYGKFRGRGACFALVLVSLIVPTQGLFVTRYLLFAELGWIDTYKPLIVPAWLGGGAFNVFLFRQFLRGIPRSYLEAACLDGATPWQFYWYVLLPSIRPAVVTAGLLSFVFHWHEFLDPLMYLSDLRQYPVSLGLRMLQSQSGTWMNLLMAASLIALVPIVLVFVLCEWQVIRGLEAVGRPIK
ncbi:MAG: carbohydrate ABC transporter permease [Planctomycetota bacterium]